MIPSPTQHPDNLSTSESTCSISPPSDQVTRTAFYIALLLLPFLGISCDRNPTAPSARARTTVTAFVPVATEYETETRLLDSSRSVTWSHPDGSGGVHVVTILTASDSIRIGVDIRDDREHNQITIHSRH